MADPASTIPSPEGFPWTWEYRVPYADCTVGNHVYYARYLDILEKARGEFFRTSAASFLQLQEQGFIFPVIEARLRYRAAARYDDVLRISVHAPKARRIRIQFTYMIHNQCGELILEAETHHVCTDLDNRPCRLPAAVEALAEPAA